PIAEEFDYDKIGSLSQESREKLKRIRPISVGQASRIAGVSPADIAVLLIAMKKFETNKMFHVEQKQ
ncbi:MAG: hypothetical protein SCK70_13020, partial [bacterium]|nr:hypothetical protein [bacterium]